VLRVKGKKVVVMKRAHLTVLPSKRRTCEICHEDCHVRYFVAAKLPRSMNLRDKDYVRVRDRLAKDPEQILRKEGLS
jgi:hypothetical protein